MTKVEKFIGIIRKATEAELRGLLEKAKAHGGEAGEIIAAAVKAEMAHRAHERAVLEGR